jgi:type IV secretory pathway VirB3-like protein
MAETFEDRAQDVAVLGRSFRIMGIPTTFFVMTVMISIPLATMVKWWMGIGFGAITLFGLYRIHENDPQALDVWINRIRSQVRVWQAGRKSARSLKFL